MTHREPSSSSRLTAPAQPPRVATPRALVARVGASVPVAATALTFLLVTAAASPALLQDEDAWRLFRRDSALNAVLPANALANNLAPVWMFQAGDSIESTAAVVDGRVYFGSLDTFFYALDLESGEELWRFQAAAEVKSSPSVFDGVVYFGDEMGEFHALDAVTGEQKWVYSTGAGIVSAANYSEGKLVFGSYDNSIYALNAADGTLAWRIQTEGYVNGTPAIVDGKVVSVGCDGFCRIIGLHDGVVLSAVQVYAYVGSSPTVADGVAYFGTFENQVLALDLDSGELLWEYEHPQRKFPYYSSAAIGGGRLLIGGRDKMMHAIDAETGAPIWTHRMRARIDSSPVIVGDRVIFGASSGEVTMLDVASGEVLWQFETGSSIVASPAIAQGRLIIGTEDGQMYAFAPAGGLP